MPRMFLFIVLLSAGSLAVAQDRIRVYQLDGSVQCRDASVTTAEQAERILEQAGVKVFGSESRKVPFDIPPACGTPTGVANVLEVDAYDWNRMLRRHADALGFGVWVFDEPVALVYKYDGSLQCERGSEIPLEVMARELTDAGIQVIARRKGTDGRMHIAMCGASTGRLNVYTIPSGSLDRARQLGFRLLVTKKMTRDIDASTSPRRAPALSRTPPQARLRERTPVIPKLW